MNETNVEMYYLLSLHQHSETGQEMWTVKPITDLFPILLRTKVAKPVEKVQNAHTYDFQMGQKPHDIGHISQDE